MVPDHPNYDRVEFLYDRKRYDEAMSELDAVARQFPNDATGFFWRAAILRWGMKRNDAAEAQVRQGLGLDAQDAYGYYLLGNILQYRDTVQALVSLDEALRLDPQYTAAFAVKADIFLEQGKWPESIEMAQAGLQHNHTHVFSLQILGRAQRDSGDLKGAEQTIRTALSHHPDNGYFHYDLGMVLLRLKRRPEALEAFQEAIAIDPTLKHRKEGLHDALRDRWPWLTRFEKWKVRNREEMIGAGLLFLVAGVILSVFYFPVKPRFPSSIFINAIFLYWIVDGLSGHLRESVVWMHPIGRKLLGARKILLAQTVQFFALLSIPAVVIFAIEGDSEWSLLTYFLVLAAGLWGDVGFGNPKISATLRWVMAVLPLLAIAILAMDAFRVFPRKLGSLNFAIILVIGLYSLYRLQVKYRFTLGQMIDFFFPPRV